LMAGRELTRIFPGAPEPGEAIVLAARNLSLPPHFQDVSFELRAGEILGIAGLVGSGRSKLAEALFGLSPAADGTVALAGQETRLGSPRAALARGLALVSEDRKESGCFLALSVLENLEITVLNRDFVRAGFVRGRAVQEACAAMSRSLRVKTAGLSERIENLSGGNQQKVLIGR